MVKNNRVFTIRLDGGMLCLDYINTVNDRFIDNAVDYLNTPIDLIDWALRLEIIDEDHHNILIQREEKEKTKAISFFEEAKSLRELLYHIFSRISRAGEIVEEDISEFNKWVSHFFSKVQLKKSHDNYIQVWDFGDEDFHCILAPIVMDAYNLLLDNAYERIKECPKCGWLFHDNSKNGRRKWCSMQTCGSTTKALEWYHRHKNN